MNTAPVVDSPVADTLVADSSAANSPVEADLSASAASYGGPAGTDREGGEVGLRDSCAVEVVDTYAAFTALEAQWNDAVRRAAIPYPFLCHEWVRTWWDAFGADATLHVVVVRSGGRIIAIAPLMREHARMYGVPVRRLRLLQNDHTPRADVIVTERPADAYGAIWRALRDESRRWDVLQLSQVERSSPTLALVSALAMGDGCSTGVWTSGASPFLELTGTWDDYLARLPAKFRSNLRNRLSRLTRLGEPALEILSERMAIAAAAPDAWRLEASGWKEQAGTAITCDPAVHAFYTELISRAGDAGWLRLLFLRVGSARVATSYGAVFDDRLFLFKTGYDPAYATGSPFKVLTFFAVREAYAQRLREIDFLGDSEPWKLEWTPATRRHDWLFVFSHSARAQLLHSLKFTWMPELKRWRA